jgi:hypothetical protein
MNRIAVILIVVIISLVGSSSASADVIPQWDVKVGGAESDTAYDVQPTADGGAIATGFASQGYMPAILVVKTDALGQLQWQRTLSLTNYGEQAYSVEQTNDGGFIVFGSSYLPAVFDYRPWLIKLDEAGNTLWSTENGLTQQVTVDSAIIRGFERADGSFVLAGGSNTFTNVQQPWVATASVTGTLESFVIYPSLATGYAEGTYVEDIAATPDGGFVLVGVSSPPLPGNAFLWKFDAEAQPEWARLYGEIFFRAAFGVEPTDDGGYVLAGCEVPNCNDSVVVKTDSQGVVQWAQALPLPLYNQGRDIVEKPSGGYLLAQTSVDAAGSTTSTADLIELSGAGDVEQVTPLLGGSASTALVRLRAVGDGFLVAGNANDADAAGNQLYLFKGQFDGANGMACPDFDGNQIVDAGDVAMVASHWQNHSGGSGWHAIYDRNGDGTVDMVDIMQVTASWGHSCS